MEPAKKKKLFDIDEGGLDTPLVHERMGFNSNVHSNPRGFPSEIAALRPLNLAAVNNQSVTIDGQQHA